jgi:DNA gyrase subunit A
MAVANISELGRATQGVKLIRLDDQDQIAAITQLDESKMDEGDGIPEVEGGPVTDGTTDGDGQHPATDPTTETSTDEEDEKNEQNS